MRLDRSGAGRVGAAHRRCVDRAHGPQLRAWPGTDPVPDLLLVLGMRDAACRPHRPPCSSSPRSTSDASPSRRHARSWRACRDPRRSLSRIRADAGRARRRRCAGGWRPGRHGSAQVPFPGGVRQRADLLVGRSWVIEATVVPTTTIPAATPRIGRGISSWSRGFTSRVDLGAGLPSVGTTEALLRTILRRESTGRRRRDVKVCARRGASQVGGAGRGGARRARDACSGAGVLGGACSGRAWGAGSGG